MLCVFLLLGSHPNSRILPIVPVIVTAAPVAQAGNEPGFSTDMEFTTEISPGSPAYTYCVAPSIAAIALPIAAQIQP